MTYAAEEFANQNHEREKTRGDYKRAGRPLIGDNADQEHEQAEGGKRRERGLFQRVADGWGA